MIHYVKLVGAWFADHDYLIPGIGVFFLLAVYNDSILTPFIVAIVTSFMCWVISAPKLRREHERRAQNAALKKMIDDHMNGDER